MQQKQHGRHSYPALLPGMQMLSDMGFHSHHQQVQRLDQCNCAHIRARMDACTHTHARLHTADASHPSPIVNISTTPPDSRTFCQRNDDSLTICATVTCISLSVSPWPNCLFTYAHAALHTHVRKHASTNARTHAFTMTCVCTHAYARVLRTCFISKTQQRYTYITTMSTCCREA